MTGESGCDALVVGAGVVGLAVARELTSRGYAVIVVERHERFGVESSSRNSEVVHSGIYYPPGSLKAELCVRGNRSLYAWCEAHDVPHRRLGKLIVATSAEEEEQLAGIFVRARTNGVAQLREYGPDRISELEPRVRASAALFSPDTGIVDSHGFMASLLGDAQARGATLAWRHTLSAATLGAGGYELVVRSQSGDESTITSRWVVNAAGLESDAVAAMPGLDVTACGYGLSYARGHYFRLSARASTGIRHLIYPAPARTGLGIHVTLDLAGGVRLGPDVEYLSDRRQDYDVRDGLRGRFHEAVSRYLEGIEPYDLSPDMAGIRAKLQKPGESFRDFVVEEESARGLPGWVNLIGIESPGLTCALEIGRRAADLLEERSA